MKAINFEEFIEIIRSYNLEEEKDITKAYHYALKYHDGQFRKSGEEYIVHPLYVAYYLAERKADRNTICAALLHDVIEDTKATKKDVEEVFGKDVVNLVMGVTKMGKIKSEEDINANLKRLFNGIKQDLRIIIIKLYDRLHNMRTLEFMTKEKQVKIAKETMEIYVPLALNIGAYNLKSEFEDLCFKYINNREYKSMEKELEIIKKSYRKNIDKMTKSIEEKLSTKEIDYELKIVYKNNFGLSKRLKQKAKVTNIHDLVIFRIIVTSVEECYKVLGCIHSLYPPINYKFKDYIAKSKTNLYQSIHTTLFGPDGRLMQVQIKTKSMEEIACYGLTAYWSIYKGNAKEAMINDLKKHFPFYKTLGKIDEETNTNKEFVSNLKEEVLASKITVFTPKGDSIELPKGSTPVDFAFKVHNEVGAKSIGAIVNGRLVNFSYKLKRGDIVEIITDSKHVTIDSKLEDIAYTPTAKNKIKAIVKKQNENK